VTLLPRDSFNVSPIPIDSLSSFNQTSTHCIEVTKMFSKTTKKIPPQEMPNNKSPIDEVPATDENDPSNGIPTDRHNENCTTVPDTNITSLNRNRKRKRADSSTKEDANENQPDVVKVCRLKIGNFSAMFEQEDIDESHTLRLLVNGDTELDTNHGDIWRDRDAQIPTAFLNPDRFSQATLHTAWSFLRACKGPSMSTYTIDQEWDFGEKFSTLSRQFPDGGQLHAAAKLFDLGRALFCPKLQRASYQWYSEVRSETWSPEFFADPACRRWVAENLPEGRHWVEEYSAWLEVLKTHDPVMAKLRRDMIVATEAGHLGWATDLPVLQVLEEPRRLLLYGYHVNNIASEEIADVDPAKGCGQ
jgi:hypothetical protein